jgi:hypothetical protein
VEPVRPTCNYPFPIPTDFTNTILPVAENIVIAVTEILNYHFTTFRGQNSLHNLSSSLTAAGVDVPIHPIAATLTTDGPDGVGTIAMESAGGSFTDTRKAFLSHTSPLHVLYAITLKKITIRLMPDAINPWFLRIRCVLMPMLKEGDALSTKPVPHTFATINRIDLATNQVAAATYDTIRLSSQNKTALPSTTT